MPLQSLFEGIPEIQIPASHVDNAVVGLTCDSRQVEPGWLFAALKGVAVDGAQFVDRAVASGASVILCANDTDIKEHQGVVYVRHPNPRKVFSLIAARFYDRQPEMIAAVTGTNGKTSTVHFCRQIWQLMGLRSASIGTTGITDSDGKFEYDRTNFLTTPDPVKLHSILQELANKDITHLAMEASSHGLDQYRLEGVRVKVAAFTNLSRDHLDYHKTFENYLAAKLRLFGGLMEPGGVAVINADVEQYEEILTLCEKREHKVLSFGKNGRFVQLINIQATRSGQQFAFEIMGRVYTVDTPLIGEFQVHNLLCALTIVLASGCNVDEAVAVLDKVEAVSGRMERVGVAGAGAGVFVDYSHTPDALEKALQVLKPFTRGKLWVVFGCGGDRDKGKRPQMGEVACKLADHVIVTDDNPRSEDPAVIRAEIIAACGINASEVADRRQAIEYVAGHAAPDDMVLIAGKGHEKTQTIGNQVLPFDDVEVARELFGKR